MGHSPGELNWVHPGRTEASRTPSGTAAETNDNPQRLMYKGAAIRNPRVRCLWLDSPTSEPESDFVCDCPRWQRGACEGETFYKEHEGKRFCVLHFPGKEKSADFRMRLKEDLKARVLIFVAYGFLSQCHSTNSNSARRRTLTALLLPARRISPTPASGARGKFRKCDFRGDCGLQKCRFQRCRILR